MRWTTLAVTMTVVLGVAACGSGPAVGRVEPGAYGATVPSAEQLALAGADFIPGGFDPLRRDAVDRIELDVSDGSVSFALDGTEITTRTITERRTVRDREGSGPFKGEKEVLVLGPEPLDLGELVIQDPVIWPGSYEGSPVVTLKAWSPDDAGPVVSCGAGERCLLLTAGSSPLGTYADSNNPALGENPIATIEITATTITYVLDSGETIASPSTPSSMTQACGLAETSVWDVPSAVGLAITDPVLVQSVCPSDPGAAIRLVIMSRPAIPVLAPLDPANEDWCDASASCLWFVPT